MTKKRIFSVLLALLLPVMAISYTSIREHHDLLGFRTSRSDYQWWVLTNASREGLESLRISGSGVLHEQSLFNSLKETGAQANDIYILDLSKDDQLYANGRPFRWFNWFPSADGVLAPYNDSYNPIALKDNFKWYVRRLVYPSPENSQIETEKQMVERMGYHYVEFTVDKRHIYPPETIDRFLAFVEDLPDDAWLHFHCDGGNSRTTTMMIIYDILHNGDTVPLDLIIARQYALGGVNINDTSKWWGGTWKQEILEMRKAMVEDFYRFRNDPEGFGKISWSEWFAKNGTAKEPVKPEKSDA